MSFEKSIKVTIETRIKDLWVDLNKSPVQWENVKFAPPSNNRYFQMFIVPLMTTPATLGIGGGRGEVIHSYELQMNLISPVDTGTNNSLDLLDEMSSLFELQSFQITGGCWIQFDQPGIKSPHFVDNNGKYVLPLRLPFFVRRNLYL